MLWTPPPEGFAEATALVVCHIVRYVLQRYAARPCDSCAQGLAQGAHSCQSPDEGLYRSHMGPAVERVWDGNLIGAISEYLRRRDLSVADECIRGAAHMTLRHIRTAADLSQGLGPTEAHLVVDLGASLFRWADVE